MVVKDKEILNLFQDEVIANQDILINEITNKSLKEVLKEMSGKDFSYFKNKLSEVLVDSVCPIGKKIKELMSDKVYLQKVLIKGKEKASKKAEENLKKIREIVGLL